MQVLRRAALSALALSLVAAGSLVAQNAAPATRVAYANPQALFEAAPGRAEAEATFQRELEGLQAQTKRMEDSLQAMVTSFTQAQATLTPAARETRQRAIQQRQGEYQQRAQALEQQAGQRREQLMQPIMDVVRRALDEVREEGNYAMIFAGDPSLILAADRNLDITERVVAKLRTMRPAAPAATTPAPAARPASGAPVSAPAGATRPRP